VALRPAVRHLVLPFCFAVVLPASLAAQFTVLLSPETDRAFDEYVKAAESEMDGRPRFETSGIAVSVAAGGRKSSIEVKDGIVHDWTAAARAPGGTVEKALAVLQSYDDYKKVYAPDVIAAKLVSREGDGSHIYVQVRKRKIVTVVLDTEYDVEVRRFEDGKKAVFSRSTRISEVDNGRALPPGTGHGFAWRANTYWLLAPQPEGVYLECRIITLSRDVPAALAWAIKPMITSMPRESLRVTLEATIRALR
jgi:hypothetical protein